MMHTSTVMFPPVLQIDRDESEDLTCSNIISSFRFMRMDRSEMRRSHIKYPYPHYAVCGGFLIQSS